MTNDSASSLTHQQHQAVTLRQVSVVLSSGAGCGKTHVLTERYLSHLRDDGAEVGQIVAITFTDRAARQMRDRIRKAVEHELRAAASGDGAERWAQHLRGLETAQISTIHSFCTSLLRQQAVEAGLDPRFDVLEDVLSANLQAEALTGCLQDLLIAQTEVGEDLRQLILLFGWRATKETVDSLVKAHDEPGWTRWLAHPAEQIAGSWLGEECARLLPRYVDYLLAADPKIARCLWMLRNTPCVGPQMRVNVSVVLEKTPRLAEAGDLAAAVKEVTEAAKVGKERAKAWQTEEDYEAVKKALSDFRETLPKQLGIFLEDPKYVTEAVIVGQRFLRVAQAAVDAYRRRKRRAGVLDFQDLLVLARDLLRDQPDVREQVQRRYHFLLIDELQDTDPVQMELVVNLCGGELSVGKLFAVGDHKQSIYRFRGADVRQFQKLRLGMPHEGRLELSMNFRSEPAILDFANALFAQRLEDYEPLQPHHAQVAPGPCVEFLWYPLEERISVGEARALEAEWIARRIRAMVDGKEMLVLDRDRKKDELRPVGQKDVVLLFRAMSNVHLYEKALRDHGLDYYLVGGRAFFAQQEIYDLLSLLRALENPQDGVSLAGTLRSPFCCLSDEALFVLGRSREGLWAGLHDPAAHARLPADQRAAADRARRHLDRWRGLKDRLPIARLLGEVFADAGYDAAMQFESLGDRKLANLWKLLELARTFDRSGLFGLAEFIQRLGDLVATQPREEQAATLPESADVVRLMSIHQAKGLEFPVVFIPDLDAQGGGQLLPVAHWDTQLGCVVRPPKDEEEEPPFSNFGWQLWKTAEDIDDWHEDLRTLYVACTRPQDYLVLSAALAPQYSPRSTWMLALAERFDLMTGSCLAEDVVPERRPKIRVTIKLDEPARFSSLAAAETPAPAMTGVHGELPREVAPIPARLGGKRLFTLSEVENALRRLAGGTARSLAAADVACQFDSEDGSDRRDWQRPRESMVRPRETMNQEVEVFARIAAAAVCYRDLEFLLEWPEQRTIRGVIDFLWQDEKQKWHLLALTSAAAPSLRDGHEWLNQQPGLVLGAMAMQRQLGVWPSTVSVYSIDSAITLSCTSAVYRHAAVLKDIDAALNALARQSLSE